MNTKSFDRVLAEVQTHESYNIHTSNRLNLGLNGTDYTTYTIGKVSRNDGKTNYETDNTLLSLGDGLVKITINRRTWGTNDRERRGMFDYFHNVIFIDAESVTQITTDLVDEIRR